MKIPISSRNHTGSTLQQNDFSNYASYAEQLNVLPVDYEPEELFIEVGWDQVHKLFQEE